MKFIMFMGYPKSGSTISGKILNSHPDIEIANQFNILEHIRNTKDINKREIVDRIISNSKIKEKKAIGTKSGHKTLKHLFGREEDLLRLKKITNMEMFFIQVIRNPFDNITSWVEMTHKMDRKNDRMLFDSKTLVPILIKQYDKLNQMITELMNENPNWYIYRLEDLINNKEKTVNSIFDYIGININSNQMKKIKGMLYDKYNSRSFIGNKEEAEDINNIIDKYPFLHGYRKE